jgi:hypothetical protein
MTPPHPTKLDKSGERDSDPVTRTEAELLILGHKSECHEEGGALYGLKAWVTKLALWQAAATGIALFLNGVGLVVLAWWLSTRLPAPPPAPRAESHSLIVPSALAQGKATP